MVLTYFIVYETYFIVFRLILLFVPFVKILGL
jgi:hypothetical protein